MAKVNYLGLFPLGCLKTYASIRDAYGPDLPETAVVMPAALTYKAAAALFWRAKGYKIISSIHIDYPSGESYDDFKEYTSSLIDPPINESHLVCRTEIMINGGVPSNGYSSQLVLIDLSFFLVEGSNNVYWKYGGEASMQQTSTGTGYQTRSVADPLSETILSTSASFEIIGETYDLMIVATKSAGTTVLGAASITGNDYWPYADSDGSNPVYDTSTGLPL